MSSLLIISSATLFPQTTDLQAGQAVPLPDNDRLSGLNLQTNPLANSFYLSLAQGRRGMTFQVSI